ncbi:hypothetical protein L218DRAFT_955738 [Marasmius fiardii PR-910]|nr:hypothetical protein L218DRAFT_955738 [Marasmius fiardii PR-910]
MTLLVSNFRVASSLLLLLNTLTTPVLADPKSKVFQWKFANNFFGTEVPTCGEFGVVVQPFGNNTANSTGVPPYYMIGYAVNGVSNTQLLGTSLDSLKWKVNFPAGTKLVLSVFDSEGTSGGIGTDFVNVVDAGGGGTASCVVNNPPPQDFIVTSNITDTINTCEPWGLRIKGGVKPYNITFMQINSPIVTNVTAGSRDDAYTYIMRGDPGKKMIAAVNDMTGRFALMAPVVSPQGSSDVDCPGLNSQGGNTTELDQQAAEARAAAEAKEQRKRTAIIAGTVVPITLVLIAGVAMWYFLWYKPRRNTRTEIDLIDPTVKPYTETGPGQVLSINAFLSDPSSSPGTPPKHPPGLTHMSYGDPEHQFDPYNQSDTMSSTSQRPDSGGGTSRHSAGRNGFTTFPSRRPSSKAAEVAMSPSSAVAESSSDQPWADAGSSVTRTTSVGRINGGEPELIIQHRDGGPGRVRELPPPYADRGQPAET